MKHQIALFEDACKVTGDDPNTIKVFDGLPERHRRHFAAHFRMEIIVEAICKIENWVADMTNLGQPKYYPWMWVKKSNKNGSGFVLTHTDCDNARTGAGLGSRFALPTPELALYVLQQWEEDCIECSIKIR